MTFFSGNPQLKISQLFLEQKKKGSTRRKIPPPRYATKHFAKSRNEIPTILGSKGGPVLQKPFQRKRATSTYRHASWRVGRVGQVYVYQGAFSRGVSSSARW